MSDSMLGRGADAAFATQKPCKHGTVLADLCGLCNTATPDALLRLRYILRREEGESRSARDRTRVFVAAAVTYIELREVIAALEAEQQEARAKTIELVAVLGIRNLAQDHVAWKKLHELMALLGIEDEE